MENNLVDREILAQYIDQLTSQKPLPATTAAEQTQQRERLMDALDQTIRLSFLNQLSPAQLDELNSLLDRADAGDEPGDAFDRFFENSGIDLEQVVSNAATHFREAYLGGTNE